MFDKRERETRRYQVNLDKVVVGNGDDETRSPKTESKSK